MFHSFKESAIEEANKHFINNNANHIDSAAIFERYAREELKIDTDIAVQDFVNKAMDGATEPADTKEYNRFYGWYYINVMGKPAINYDLRISREVALRLLAVQSYLPEHAAPICEELNLQIYCLKSTGWEEVTHADFDNVEQKEEIEIFEIRFPKNEDENTINVVWSVEDVQEQAKDDDVKITEEEAREILHYIKKNHDASIGINWEVITQAIQVYEDNRHIYQQ